jgi:hypothetical protein
MSMSRIQKLCAALEGAGENDVTALLGVASLYGFLRVVGSGQSALSADTPHFAKLRDRFVVRVELTDADVEAVTRQILLRKKQSAVPAIEEMFEGHAGEVLVDQSVLLKVGEEHRLQTTEGAEWEREYRQRVGALRQNEVEIARIRNQLFRDGADEAVRSLRLTQGDSKERRAVRLHASDEAPSADDAAVIVWLRDGWSCQPKAVADAARSAGVESPTVFVHLPRRHAEALRDGVLSSEAAQRILDLKGSPAMAEGRDARAGMESRREEASRRLRELVQETLRAAVVHQGGGTEVFGEGLRDKLDKAARASMARLFPEFPKADHRAWEVALRRARDGSDTPLQIVGWDRPTVEHAVARQVLAMVGVGARGTEIHRKLRVAPFGWPQDAVDAVLIALHRSDDVRAMRGGAPVAPGALDQAGIKSAEFRTEKIVLTASERIALRGLFQEAGVQAASGQESLQAAPFLDAMRALAGAAGGDAPLPPVPDTVFLDDLSGLAGTEQLAGILGERERIRESLAEWGALAERREARLPAWKQAMAMLRHSRELAGSSPSTGNSARSSSSGLCWTKQTAWRRWLGGWPANCAPP